jgi:hypothetical protein
MSEEALLPASLHAAVESAGYRVARWVAARHVLRARATRGRLPELLGVFLLRWMPAVPPPDIGDAFRLVFSLAPGRVWFFGGDGGLVASPPERALLHLPALKSFWRKELRHAHFEALKRAVPPAWFMDEASVPPGAVIHGLDVVNYERLETSADAWDTSQGVLCRRQPTSSRISARYGRDERGRVVLRSIEAAS